MRDQRESGRVTLPATCSAWLTKSNKQVRCGCSVIGLQLLIDWLCKLGNAILARQLGEDSGWLIGYYYYFFFKSRFGPSHVTTADIVLMRPWWGRVNPFSMVAYTLVFLSLQILMLLDGVPLSLQSEEVIDFKQVELVEQLEHNMTKWCDNMELTFRAAPECGFPATRRLYAHNLKKYYKYF